MECLRYLYVRATYFDNCKAEVVREDMVCQRITLVGEFDEKDIHEHITFWGSTNIDNSVCPIMYVPDHSIEFLFDFPFRVTEDGATVGFVLMINLVKPHTVKPPKKDHIAFESTGHASFVCGRKDDKAIPVTYSWKKIGKEGWALDSIELKIRKSQWNRQMKHIEGTNKTESVKNDTYLP
jgi:hypothetical protein